MPHATTDDGVNLYFEQTGAGTAVIFVHEFAGDHRSWEPQLRHFGQRYHAIAYNARGYPPSDVPLEVSLGPNKTVVVIFPDSGERYLSMEPYFNI